jgi:hypothetical protein
MVFVIHHVAVVHNERPQPGEFDFDLLHVVLLWLPCCCLPKVSGDTAHRQALLPCRA